MWLNNIVEIGLGIVIMIGLGYERGKIIVWGTIISGIISIEGGNIMEGIIYIIGGICMKGIKGIGIIGGLSIIGTIMMIKGESWIMVYLGLEIQSLAYYVIAAWEKRSGLKYYVMGGVASGMIIMGIAGIYKETGRIEGGGILMLIGLTIKLGVLPVWIADVYTGAPIWGARMLSVLGGIGPLTIIARIGMEGAIGKLSILAWIIGTVGMMYTRRAERFMAYSGIGHVGWMYMGVIGRDWEIYIIIYMIMTWTVWTIMEREGIRRIEEARGMNIMMLSMIGLPPLLGFIGKMNVIVGSIGMREIAIVGLIAGVIGAYNYIRWMNEKGMKRGDRWIAIGTILQIWWIWI